MSKSPFVPYEIAWIQNGQRVQTHVLIPPAALPTLDGLSNGVRAAQPFMDEVQGFEFLRLPPQDETTSDPPSALLDTIISALGIEEDDEDYDRLTSLIEATSALDELVDAHPDKATERGVEFVWDNGGGDDNMFTQHFLSVPNSPEEAKFFELLEEFGGRDAFYDFTYFSPGQGRDDLASIDDLVDIASEMSDAQPLVDFLTAVSAVDRRDRLADLAAEVAPATSQRASLPKM